MDGILTTGTVISEVIEHLGNFILRLQKGNKVYFVSTLGKMIQYFVGTLPNTHRGSLEQQPCVDTK